MSRQNTISKIAVGVLATAITALGTVLYGDAAGHDWVTSPVLGTCAAIATALIILALVLGLYATQDQKLDAIDDKLQVLVQLPAVVERAEGTIDDLRVAVAGAMFAPGPRPTTPASGRVTQFRPRRP